MVLLHREDGVGRCPGMSPVFVLVTFQRTRLAAQLRPRSPQAGGSCLPQETPAQVGVLAGCSFRDSAISDGNLSCSKSAAPMRAWLDGR